MTKLNVATIVNQRDAYPVYTPQWCLLNDLKNITLVEQKPSTNEMILYFDEVDLDKIPLGYSDLTEETEKVLMGLRQEFNMRYALEYSCGVFRHPIPYVVLRHEDKYFFILREGGSGELRLIGKKGLVGGHVGMEDEDTFAVGTIINGMAREVLEEVGVGEDMVQHAQLRGIIRSNDGVDADHLGLVFVLELNTDQIKAEEEGVLSGIWIHKDDLHKHVDTFENWSRLVYENILSK